MYNYMAFVLSNKYMYMCQVWLNYCAININSHFGLHTVFQNYYKRMKYFSDSVLFQKVYRVNFASMFTAMIMISMLS